MRGRSVAGFALAALALAACGGGDDDVASGGDRPTVAVTTTVLGDVVRAVAGDQVEVVVVMPVGADPHDFQASAQQVQAIREADALVVNGAGFEEGLLDVVASAEADGVPTHEAIDGVEVLELGASSHGHGDDAHADDADGDEAHGEDEAHGADEAHADGEEHGEDEAHGDDEHAGGEGAHEGVDPHFFQDPARMAVAAAGIGDFLAAEVDGIDAAALEAGVDAYVAELEALDAEVEALLAAVPAERRVLVTNHDAFGYFADRYGLEVVGTVIPSGSTSDGAAAGDLAELAEVVRAEAVPAIFTENVSSDDLARTLADEVGGAVEVVELLTDSLGEDEGRTYVELVRTNAERIADALA